MSKKFNLAGMEIELAEGVHLSTSRRKRPACYILDTADRVAALAGEPAKRFYIDMVKQHERWTHSEDEMCQDIFHEEYVYKAQLLEYKSSLEIPYGGVVEAPQTFQERINPDVFIEQMRNEAIELMVELKANTYPGGDIYNLIAETAGIIFFLDRILQTRIPPLADKYLTKLRRLRTLEFYMTSEQIIAAEELIHTYMYKAFRQYYYL